MHNLHVIVVPADSGEEAIRQAEHYLSGWGTANNWRSFSGAIAENGERYEHEKTRFRVPETVKGLNAAFRALEILEYPEQVDALRAKSLKDLTSYESSMLHSFYDEFRYQKCGEGADGMASFNVFENQYPHNSFDDFGCTHASVDNYAVYGEENRLENKRLWAVIVDMHS